MVVQENSENKMRQYRIVIKKYICRFLKKKRKTNLCCMKVKLCPICVAI